MGQTEGTKAEEERKDSEGLTAETKKSNNGLGTIDDYPWFRNRFRRN